MKKFFLILSIIVVVVIVAFGGYKSALAAKDLCGGTNGNGEIMRVGSNTFTLRLNEGGEKGGGTLIVNLTDRATIETPAGYASASDLKIGDRVTIVGDNHRDRPFGQPISVSRHDPLERLWTGSPLRSSGFFNHILRNLGG